MEFGNGFYMPPGEDYGRSTEEDNGTMDVGVNPITDIGFSVPFGIAANNMHQLVNKIRTGARIVELQFFGYDKSSRGSVTPEALGSRFRTALREISEIQNVEFSTHSSGGVYGLAGKDQQGNYSPEKRKRDMDELRKAIDFAADVARGGSVVVHTGEMDRSFVDASWNHEGEYAHKFKKYDEEEHHHHYMVVDSRNGELVRQAVLTKGKRYGAPVWLTAKEGQKYIGSDGKEHEYNGDGTVYLDYNGNEVAPERRVPEYDFKSREFKRDYFEFDHFEDEAKDLTKRAKEFWRQNKDKSDDVWKNSPYVRFKDAESEDQILIRPEEAYAQMELLNKSWHSEAFAMSYQMRVKGEQERLERLERAYKHYKEYEETIPEEERWRIKKRPQLRSELEQLGIVAPEEEKLPSELIEDELKQIKQQIAHDALGGSSQWENALNEQETARHLESSETYALKQSFKSYAEAGMHAFEKTRQLETEGVLKKPLFIGMENIYPDTYGGHPDELMHLVRGSRQEMVKMLVKQRGMDKEEAEKFAEVHIKGHLDTGHLNMWRKFWIHDPDKSVEQNNKEFNTWAIKKVEELAKNKMIGSVHLVDNYGFSDEHLSPGEGNTPVREMVAALKKHGYDGNFVVEPGAAASWDNSDFHGLMQTWKLFGNVQSRFGAYGSTSQQRWGSIQGAYFGRAHPPYFMVGEYVPSEDWRMWSGVGLE